MVKRSKRDLGLRSNLQPRTPPGDKGVIVQMFQWNYDSIAAECTRYLGPAGYGYVQVGPANEHITGDEWWTDYQAVSYKMGSKHGNQAQFQNMINQCHAAGVGVIVDSVWNHMTGQTTPGVGTAGSPYSKYDYPGIYGYNDFHHKNTTPGCTTSDNSIQDWNSVSQVQTCELETLADLMTSTEKVRSTLASFYTSLVSMGVDGFRIDAAKHVPVQDLQNIIARLPAANSGKPLYYQQEVVYEGGAGVTSAEYTPIGEVEEFRYPDAIKAAFEGGNLQSLQNMEASWLPSASANVFVCNHDRERGGAMNYKEPNNMYTLATVFSLAYPYGTPTVPSSYSFTDVNAGPPNNGGGQCTGNGPMNGWQCQHTWTSISGMTGFFNAVKGKQLKNWSKGTNNQMSFFRGSVGFVAINNDNSQWSMKTLQNNQLPPGKYCDVIAGGLNGDGTECIGTMYEIPASGSPPALVIPAHSTVAFHTKAVVSPLPVKVTITFSVKEVTSWGDSVVVCGSVPELGNWNPSRCLPLSASQYTTSNPVWQGSVTLTNTNIQYKYVKVPAGGAPQWEPNANRQYFKGTAPPVTISSTYGTL